MIMEELRKHPSSMKKLFINMLLREIRGHIYFNVPQFGLGFKPISKHNSPPPIIS